MTKVKSGVLITFEGCLGFLIPYAIIFTTVAISKLVVFTKKKRLKFIAPNRQKAKYQKIEI